MKLIKSRREFKCHDCKKNCKKGEKYLKKATSIGSPNKETYDKEKGAFVLHGLRITLKYCQSCAERHESLEASWKELKAS